MRRAGCKDQPPVARRKRLCRLAVDGHHAHIVIGDAERDRGAMAAVDEAQAQSLIGACRNGPVETAVDRVDGRGLGRARAGGDRRAVPLQPPVLDQQNFVAIDLRWVCLRHGEGGARQRALRTLSSDPRLEEVGAGGAQRDRSRRTLSGGDRALRQQGNRARHTIEAIPVQVDGRGSGVGQFEFQGFAAPERPVVRAHLRAEAPCVGFRLRRLPQPHQDVLQANRARHPAVLRPQARRAGRQQNHRAEACEQRASRRLLGRFREGHGDADHVRGILSSEVLALGQSRVIFLLRAKFRVL